MAMIYAASNSREIGELLTVRAARLRVLGRALGPELAEAQKRDLLAALAEEAPRAAEHQGDGPPLAESFAAEIRPGPDGAEIGFTSAAPYAGFVLHGTGIYATPEPHQAWDVDGYQAFTVQGAKVYAMHTHHEGQHPNDYAGRALERAQPALALALRAVGDKILAVFA